MKEKKKLSMIFVLFWLFITIIGSLFIISELKKETLWFDESYSAMIIKQSIPDIIKITASDSHPPLYYVVLSLYSKIFGRTSFVLRFFSFLGIFGLAILGLISIKKLLGKEIAIIYTFLLFLFPVFINMGQELRMYTWGAFFVTISAIEIFNFIHRENKYSAIKFLIFSILSMWTHYFSLLAIAVIDMIVFLWIIYRRKKWAIIPFFILIFIQIITYIPWVFALLFQIKKVAKDFWIEKINFWAFLGILLFPFSDKFGVYWIERPYTDLVALFFSIVLILFGIFKAIKNKREKDRFALFSFLIYFFTLLFGILISEFFRPILVPRYLTVVTALLLIFISYSIGKISNKILKYTAIAIYLICLIPINYFIKTNRFNGAMEKVINYMHDKITKDDIFLHVDEHTFGTFVYYFPENKHYLYLGPAYKGYSGYDAYKPIGIVLSNNINGFMKQNQTFWLVNRIFAPQTLLSESWIFTGKLILKGPPKVFQYKASFYRPKLFKVTPSTNNYTDLEWGTLNTTNLLDPHIYSDKNVEIKITINGLKKIKGNLTVIIYEDNIIPENIFMFKTKKVNGSSAYFIFENVPSGKYSFFVYQDLNLNEKPDKIFGFITEPYGLSGKNEDESEINLVKNTNIIIQLRGKHD